MFPKLPVVAFVISLLCNKFHLVASTQCGSIEFTSFTSGNDVEIICRDQVIPLQGRHLCHYNGSATSNISDQPTTTFTITEDREGLYSCCCSSNCTAECHTATIPILAGPLESSAPLILVHEWGEYFQVQCPYVPGPLVDSYMLAWYFNNFAAVTLFSSNDFTAINNTLNGKLFNPLDMGNYTCEVSTNTTSEIGIVQVSLAEDNTIIPNITTGPSSIVLRKPSNDTIDFHCTASVPSFKLIGFLINQTDGSGEFEIIPNRSICWYERSSPSVLKCEKSNALLNCSYDKPYEIDCSLTLEGFQTQSSYISCYIAELDGSRSASNATVSQSAGIFTIPEMMNCSKAVYNSSTNSVIQPFPYPITVLPVTVEFFNSYASASIIITKQGKHVQGELDDTKTMVTFTIPDGFNSYRILFNEKMATGSCDVPDFPPIITSSSAPSVSPVPTLQLPISRIPSITFSPPPSMVYDNGVSIAAIVGGIIGATFSVLLIAIMLLVIIMLIRISRSSKHSKSKPGTMGLEFHPVQSINVEHPASPNDSCSQPSTLDTFLDRSYDSSHSSHSHSTNSCPSTRHLNRKPLPRYGISDNYPQLYPPLSTSLLNSRYPNPPEISVITPTPTMEDHSVLSSEHCTSGCISPTGTNPYLSPISLIDDNKQKDYFTSKKDQNRPSDLPIGPSAKTPNSAAATPLSDQTMIGILLYLQHKECNKPNNCQTCKLIDMHFARIANKYGQNALTGMMKNLNTPGGKRALKHLRKKKIQRTRSPQHAPLLVMAGCQRQRSHSASHLDEDELTFSGTETDEDTLKSSNKRIKPMKGRKANTIHERKSLGYFNQKRNLPLQNIETLYPPLNTAADCPYPGHVVSPSSFTKGSESDLSDSSTATSPIESQFDRFKPKGLFMPYTKSSEESLPQTVNLHPEEITLHASTTSYRSASSGYETDRSTYAPRIILPVSNFNMDADERNKKDGNNKLNWQSVGQYPVYMASCSATCSIQYESIPFTDEGLFYHSHDYGITVIIPPGAVQGPAVLQFGATQLLQGFKSELGPDCYPVSPFVWIHTEPILTKPAELYIPHCVDTTMDDDTEIHLLTRNHQERPFKINDRIVISVNANVAKLISTHFCSLCLVYPVPPKKRYQLICARKEIDDNTVHCDISVLYTWKCLQTYKRNHEGCEITQKPIPSNFGELRISVNLPAYSGWQWRYRDLQFKVDNIKEKEVDFYKVLEVNPGDITDDDVETLQHYEENGIYPPGFKLSFNHPDSQQTKSSQVEVSVNSDRAETVFSISFDLKGADHNETVHHSPLDTDMDTSSLADSAYYSYRGNKTNGFDSDECAYNIAGRFRNDLAHKKEKDRLVINAMTFLQPRISPDYFKFGHFLGISIQVLQGIEESVGHIPERCVKNILLHWRKTSKDVSSKAIANALEASGYPLLAAIASNHFDSTAALFCSLCDKPHGERTSDTESLSQLLNDIAVFEKQPNLADLDNLVAARIPARWREFGVQLGIELSEMEAIKVKNLGDCKLCFIELLDLWRQRRGSTGHYTWSTVIKVLHSPSLKEYLLAEKIYKFCLRKSSSVLESLV